MYGFGGLSAGDYKLEFPAPDGMQWTLGKQGNNPLADSDPAATTGQTECFSIADNQVQTGIDAGMIETSDDKSAGDRDPSIATEPASGGGGAFGIWAMLLLTSFAGLRRREGLV
jgi:MYXO-CTERM domain-containing protein